MNILLAADMLSIFDVIILVYGGYTIYSAVIMRRDGVPGNWLLGNVDISKCRDVTGFVDYIYRKTIIFGFMAILYGILGCINSFVTPLGIFNLIGITIFLIGCIIFIVLLNKGKNKFL